MFEFYVLYMWLKIYKSINQQPTSYIYNDVQLMLISIKVHTLNCKDRTWHLQWNTYISCYRLQRSHQNVVQSNINICFRLLTSRRSVDTDWGVSVYRVCILRSYAHCYDKSVVCGDGVRGAVFTATLDTAKSIFCSLLPETYASTFSSTICLSLDIMLKFVQ